MGSINAYPSDQKPSPGWLLLSKDSETFQVHQLNPQRQDSDQPLMLVIPYEASTATQIQRLVPTLQYFAETMFALSYPAITRPIQVVLFKWKSNAGMIVGTTHQCLKNNAEVLGKFLTTQCPEINEIMPPHLITLAFNESCTLVNMATRVPYFFSNKLLPAVFNINAPIYEVKRNGSIEDIYNPKWCKNLFNFYTKASWVSPLHPEHKVPLRASFIMVDQPDETCIFPVRNIRVMSPSTTIGAPLQDTPEAELESTEFISQIPALALSIVQQYYYNGDFIVKYIPKGKSRCFLNRTLEYSKDGLTHIWGDGSGKTREILPPELANLMAHKMLPRLIEEMGSGIAQETDLTDLPKDIAQRHVKMLKDLRFHQHVTGYDDNDAAAATKDQ